MTRSLIALFGISLLLACAGCSPQHGKAPTTTARAGPSQERDLQITLTPSEIAVLMKQDPDSAQDGGFQSLMVKLQGKLDKKSGALSLTGDDLERIHRYAFDYRNGGWENRLKEIFGRALGPGLKAPPN